MDFGDMLKEMKAHPEKKFARRGWNGKGIYIQLQVPDKYSMMTLPYIYMVTDNLKSDNPDAPRGRVPWLASQTDILTDDDWVEVGSAPSGDPRPSYPLCDEVRSTLEINSDLAVDCVKDKTFRFRSLGPRVYFTEMDAESIIKFLKMFHTVKTKIHNIIVFFVIAHKIVMILFPQKCIRRNNKVFFGI